MRNINIIETAKVNTGAEKAWEIIGPDFVNIAVWGPGINKSWKNDSIEATMPDAPAGGRFCDLGKQGIIDEKILHYDQDNYEITWSADSDTLPSFIRDLQNTIKVEKIDEHTCQILSSISANAEGVIGFFLAGLVKKNFAKTLPEFLEAWKLYAETGTLTNSKQKESSGSLN